MKQFLDYFQFYNTTAFVITGSNMWTVLLAKEQYVKLTVSVIYRNKVCRIE